MCGIVALFLKNKELESRIGELFAPMLICMTDRGPDSAGLALYGSEVTGDQLKVTIQHPEDDYNWSSVKASLNENLGVESDFILNSNHAIFTVSAKEEKIMSWLKVNHPDLTLMSIGQSIEILKEVGLPKDIVKRFNVDKLKGSHIIGHTRMATESAVTTAGSHPFTTGNDICLVHNGSLSNHNRLRSWLTKNAGIQFQTENDSEVAAAYLMWKLTQGASIKEALESAIDDLDGFFTFAVGTKDGFAAMRDPIACKPAVLAETDDYVAMASEYQALSDLPGAANADIWEPEPGVVYSWSHN